MTTLSDFFNNLGDYTLYYSKARQSFVLCSSSERPCKDYIMAPNYSELDHAALQRFKSDLNEEDSILLDDFTEKKGFFRFLKETGLIYRYYEAREEVESEVLSQWAKENGLSIDWENVSIETN